MKGKNMPPVMVLCGGKGARLRDATITLGHNSKVKFDEKPVKSIKYINGGYTVVDRSDPKVVHEAGLLNLDIAKAREVLGWTPRWNAGGDVAELTRRQILEYAN